MTETSERLENGVVSNCVLQSTPSDNLLRTWDHGEDTVSPLVVSPEMLKSMSVKRFKYSPGMVRATCHAGRYYFEEGSLLSG